MASRVESQLEPSNVIPSKIEPLHREIPGVGSNSVETSTRPAAGVRSPVMTGLKWGGMAYASAWIVPFLITLGVAAKADWFGGPVGIQVLLSVVAFGLAVLAGIWAGKGRPAWRNPARGVVAVHAVSVLLLAWAVRGTEMAERLPWGRSGVIGLGLVSLAIVGVGVWMGMAGNRDRAEAGGALSRSRVPTILGVVLGVVAQLALGGAWYQVARAVMPSPA